MNKPVQLYIAFSDQATEKPIWLDPFQDTGEDLTFFSSPGKIVNLSLYRAVFPAGELKLGENDPANDSHTMYTIVIKE